MKDLPQDTEPRVLILTSPAEVHSFAVKEGLQRKGVEVDLWHTPDFPTLQAGSLWFEGDQNGWEVIGPDLEIRDTTITSLWVRRPTGPVLPDQLDPADREFALRESTLFARSLYRVAGSQAFWVNPLEGQRRANLKAQQLLAASKAGFKIPRTLCSNDPARIREFLRSNQGGVIYKSFYPVSWRTQEGVATLFSTEICEEDLPEDTILRASPGIFQELVPKSHELRITAMGNRMFTAKLRSQEIPEGRIDWRAAFDRLPMEAAELSEPVADACRKVMTSLGLAFGCFDVVVTPTGEYVFLEVNEMGAFLWIEEAVEELRLLDAFCEFLIQGRVDFQWRPSRGGLTWRDVSEETLRQIEVEAPQAHIRIPTESILDDRARK